MLIDHMGRPLQPKNTEDKEDLKKRLADFMDTNKDKMQAWFAEHGTHVRPPIFYNTDEKKWYWANRQERRR